MNVTTTTVAGSNVEVITGPPIVTARCAALPTSAVTARASRALCSAVNQPSVSVLTWCISRRRSCAASAPAAAKPTGVATMLRTAYSAAPTAPSTSQVVAAPMSGSGRTTASRIGMSRASSSP